jgi:hypothetical protein
MSGFPCVSNFSQLRNFKSKPCNVRVHYFGRAVSTVNVNSCVLGSLKKPGFSGSADWAAWRASMRTLYPNTTLPSCPCARRWRACHSQRKKVGQETMTTYKFVFAFLRGGGARYCMYWCSWPVHLVINRGFVSFEVKAKSNCKGIFLLYWG